MLNNCWLTRFILRFIC